LPVTDPKSPDFVPEPERIATFDNDGTLWAEQPIYTQLIFAIDRVRALAPEHPEWKNTQPFQAVLEGDMKALAAGGTRGLLELVMATHAGMTTAQFEVVVTDWLATARHPTTGMAYTEMVYQPMLEWTTAGEGARLGVLVHHTDADREWAYDRDSHIGRLDRGLDEAAERGWVAVGMKEDWKVVFP
jgi:hypothetical protein